MNRLFWLYNVKSVIFVKLFICDLPQEVQSEDALHQQRTLLVFNHVVKMLASKRLMSDQRLFRQVLLPYCVEQLKMQCCRKLIQPLLLPFEIKKRKLPSVIIQWDANSNFLQSQTWQCFIWLFKLISNALCPFLNGAGQTAKGTYHNGK